MNEKTRHAFLYSVVHRVAPVLLRKYDFSTDVFRGDGGNYLVLSNHLTEDDLLMLAAAFRKQMYFVAGEHLLRSRFGRFLRWLQDPIFEAKGAPSLKTVREIIRRTREGANVMLFPEGSRNFSGETMRLPESVAKLAKLCRCGLITYHIEGGYFVAPRWAYTFRVGPMKGKLVKVRSAEEVAAMSVPDLTEAINRELYENAYTTQRRNRFKYKGDRLAEGLENYLVRCPACGGFDTLESRDNTFRCTACGLSGTYTEEGFLEGESLPFDSVYDWGKWAEAGTEAFISQTSPGEICFRDKDVVLSEIGADHEKTILGTGELIGFRDRFEMDGRTFDFGKITAMNMLYYGKSLLFTCDEGYFEMTGSRFHAIKYQKLYDLYSE